MTLRTPAPSDAEAAHVLAMYAAEGRDAAPDWEGALDHLQQAAELGHGLAQAELAALCGDWALAQKFGAGKSLTEGTWGDLRRAVDLQRLLTPPRANILSASPRIAAIEAMVAPELCDWLIARARIKLAPAEVYDHETGSQRIEAVRTNSAAYFLWEDSDFLLLALRARMAAAAELPVYAMESTAVLHYTAGQEFMPHFDFLDVAKPGHAKDVAGRGQRVLTFLIALNEGYEGGQTEFPTLGKRWKGRKGSALFFWNVEPDGSVDRRMLHAGLPPTRGEKWLLSQWIRGRPIQS
ncbi:MAG TPA: 2OG-Fe(II) oxygenase [Micropepsaceae bacterium]